MKKSLLAAAALATLAMGGTAGAADIAPSYKAPPPAPAAVRTWTGCYVGIGAGYGMYNVDHTGETTAGVPFSILSTAGGRGWLGTVQGGCDYQFAPSWVIGAFADYDWRGLKGQYSTSFPPFAYGLMTGTLSQRSSWAAGARLGYLVSPSLLTFVSGGFTSTRYDAVNFRSGDTGAGPQPPGTPNGLQMPAQTFNGYFIGSGVEYAIGLFPGLFWKTEYRFADYRPRLSPVNCVFPFSTGNQIAPPSCTAGTVRFNDRMHAYDQTIRSELVWRF